MCLGCNCDFERVVACVLKSSELVNSDLLLLVFAEDNLCHCHLCGICIIADFFDIFQNLGFAVGTALKCNSTCLQEQSELNLVAVSLYQILWICLFLVTGNSVLDLHTRVLLYCLDATLASILLVKFRRSADNLFVYYKFKCESAVTVLGDFKLSCHSFYLLFQLVD